MSKIVIALGGNALGTTLPEQAIAVKITAKSVINLLLDGNEIVVVHGNGPQVGIINNAMSALMKVDPSQGFTPLSVCGAMSQAYIGYDLQSAFLEEMEDRGVTDIPVCTIVTRVEVDADDPAFLNPTKPIGKFMTETEAKEFSAKTGFPVREDAGRGWRRYVASPMPIDILELRAIRNLMDSGHLVVCCGGGGIPVFKQEGNHYKGAAAVIDKDHCAELLAEKLDADIFIILTAVDKVCINYRKPDEKQLASMTVEEARRYAADGQFAPGSMLPKVEAGARFAAGRKGRKSIITSLEHAMDALHGLTGTVIE